MLIKKINSVVLFALASLLSLTTTTNASAYQAAQKPNNSQLDIISAKTVEAQTTLTGIRDYTNVVLSNRTYQKGDVILIEIIVEMKDITKPEYKTLKNVSGEELELALGSKTVDFSLTKASSPVLVYGEQNKQKLIDIAQAVKYNKKENLITLNIFGNGQQNAIPNIKQSQLELPTQQSMQYQIVFTGVVDSGEKGEYFSAIKISGTEKFKNKNKSDRLVVKDNFEVYKSVVFPADVDNALEQKENSKAWVRVDGKKVAQVNPKAQDGVIDSNWAGGATKNGKELLSEKTFYFQDGKTVDGQNGIVVYTIATPQGRPIVSLASEWTYYEGDDASSIALFVPDDGKGYARRIGSAIGGSLTYLDKQGGNVAQSREIANALRFFGLDTGLGNSYKLTDFVFEKQAIQSSIGSLINCSYPIIVENEKVVIVEEEEVVIIEQEEVVENENINVEEEIEQQEITNAPIYINDNDVIKNPVTSDRGGPVVNTVGIYLAVVAVGFFIVARKIK